MKVTINFDLDNLEIDDNINYKIFTQSLGMYSLDDILQYLRNEIKYGDDEIRGNHLDSVRDKVIEILNENNVNLNL